VAKFVRAVVAWIVKAELYQSALHGLTEQSAPQGRIKKFREKCDYVKARHNNVLQIFRAIAAVPGMARKSLVTLPHAAKIGKISLVQRVLLFQ
jgi:hypothetical protein